MGQRRRNLQHAAAPVAEQQRVQELDVLRGFALFGVLVGCFTEYIRFGLTATEEQLAALSTASVDPISLFFVKLLVTDKANTLFAFLFGLGFSIQMQRMSARGADFEAIYLRRLFILLVFGWIHMLFIFPWDILHLYALMGLVLFALRKRSDHFMLVGGVLLALFGYMAGDWMVAQTGVRELLASDSWYESAATLERQSLAANGDYFGLTWHFVEMTWFDWIAGAGIVGFSLYALGRFMLGNWVGRQGWLQHAGRYMTGYRRWLWRCLPLGLALELLSQAVAYAGNNGMLGADDSWELGESALHMVATPLISIGYLCAIVVGLQGGLGQRALRLLAPVGKMALTNYVLLGQIVVCSYYWFGLAGKVGITHVVGLSVVTFALQIAFSHWWMRSFLYGPLEWLWRGLTYGHWPQIRRRLSEQ